MLASLGMLWSQDVLVLSNGDEIEAKILEIGIDEIKYKKYSMLDGPDYLCRKAEVFMIKFENGSKEVFGNTGNQQSEVSETSGSGTATLYFIRPKRFAGSRPEIIVGTSVPDEVILKLKNGRWHRVEYPHTGHREFVVGIYALNPEPINLNIQAGETYYFFCEPTEKGLTLIGSMKLIDKQTAEGQMAELKEQAGNMVGR